METQTFWALPKYGAKRTWHEIQTTMGSTAGSPGGTDLGKCLSSLVPPWKKGRFREGCGRPYSPPLQAMKVMSQVCTVISIWHILGFPGGSAGKESACNAGDPGFDSWLGKIPWRRKWQPTPAFLPGESHGQRSLVAYSPWDCKSRS